MSWQYSKHQHVTLLAGTVAAFAMVCLLPYGLYVSSFTSAFFGYIECKTHEEYKLSHDLQQEW